MKYVIILSITFLLGLNLNGEAQCHGDFKIKTSSSEKDVPTGKIELTVNNPAGGTYTFKLYRISGAFQLIQSKEIAPLSPVVFEKLESAEYIVKVEWGGGCSKNVGGLGIVIPEKTEEK